MENKILTGIVALLLILQTYQLVGDREPTHYSDSLQEKRYCDRLSSTEKTCYPYPEITIGKRYSSDGWKEIPFIKEEIIKGSSYSGKAWECPKRPNPCREVTI